MIPPGEKIVEIKKCHLSGQEFFVTDKDVEFYDKISPIFSWNKYIIPAPSLCPDERQKRRLSWRNEQKLYKRKCDKTGREVVSLYASEKDIIVYDQKVWWSDEWSPMDYWVDFDFSRPFFEQFGELMKRVPLPATLGRNLENSDYSLHSADLKNCYLVVSTISGEELLYGYQGNGSKNCIDFYQSYNSEYCYQIIDTHNSHRCYFSQDLDDCRDCTFCYDCKSCNDCLFCFNLRGKKYCINNKQYTSEEYEQEKWKISLSHHFPILQKRWHEMLPKITHRCIHGIKNENCLGDYLNSCSDCFHCFNYAEGESLRYVSTGRWAKNSYDCNYTTGEWALECLSPFPASHVAFSAYAWWSVESYYLFYCQSCTGCFGSVSLKHQKHCVLNRPYSQQEYESLCGYIIDHMRSTGEWWEFFPHELSPFGYNETVAQEYFPLTEEEVKSRGWNWYNAPEKSFDGGTLQPLSISEYDEKTVWFEVAQKNIDTLLAWVVKCEITGKPFKIIKQELAFYIEHYLPIPTKHPDQRHKERMDMRNPRTLFERTCAECHKDIITTYTPDRPERVVCEECYRKLVY